MSSVSTDHTQLFARIHLHGVTKSTNGTPCPIDLERKISFPVPANCTSITQKEHNKDLSPRLLAPRYDIDARVCFDHRMVKETAQKSRPATPDPSDYGLGAGHAGMVYPLEIMSFKPANSSTPCSEIDSFELPILPQLCIKIATPGFVRNFAREAWFYEQLDSKGLTGFVVPRCYGVFHSPHIPGEVTIDIPGFDYHKSASRPVSDTFLGRYTAQLPEEFIDWDDEDFHPNTRCFLDDQKKSYTNSEWRQIRETPRVATMTVLVMDMLGERLTLEEFEKDWKGEINDIFDHLAPLDIVHNDLRFPNVLRVPPHLQVPCPMHPNAGPGHRWNITDWEYGGIECIGRQNRVGIWDQRLNLCEYYSTIGGKKVKELWVYWQNHFEEIENTRELVYIGNSKQREPDPASSHDQLLP